MPCGHEVFESAATLGLSQLDIADLATSRLQRAEARRAPTPAGWLRPREDAENARCAKEREKW